MEADVASGPCSLRDEDEEMIPAVGSHCGRRWQDHALEADSFDVRLASQLRQMESRFESMLERTMAKVVAAQMTSIETVATSLDVLSRSLDTIEGEQAAFSDQLNQQARGQQWLAPMPMPCFFWTTPQAQSNEMQKIVPACQDSTGGPTAVVLADVHIAGAEGLAVVGSVEASTAKLGKSGSAEVVSSDAVAVQLQEVAKEVIVCASIMSYVGGPAEGAIAGIASFGLRMFEARPEQLAAERSTLAASTARPPGVDSPGIHVAAAGPCRPLWGEPCDAVGCRPEQCQEPCPSGIDAGGGHPAGDAKQEHLPRPPECQHAVQEQSCGPSDSELPACVCIGMPPLLSSLGKWAQWQVRWQQANVEDRFGSDADGDEEDFVAEAAVDECWQTAQERTANVIERCAVEAIAACHADCNAAELAEAAEVGVDGEAAEAAIAAPETGGSCIAGEADARSCQATCLLQAWCRGIADRAAIEHALHIKTLASHVRSKRMHLYLRCAENYRRAGRPWWTAIAGI